MIRGKWLAVAGAVLLGALFVWTVTPGGDSAHAEGPVVIVVTSGGDGEDATCPDPVACTLRAAIDLANADESGETVTITFDPATFGEDGVIAVGDLPLPALTRANASIDGGQLPITITGPGADAGTAGVLLAGERTALRGVRVGQFATCVGASGTSAVVRDVAVGNCGTGIAIDGAGTVVEASAIGFAANGTAAPVDAGIRVRAPDVRIGGEAAGNRIGNATIAVEVGGGSTAFAGTLIAQNVIGRSTAAQPAPVAIGVQLRQPSIGTRIAANSFFNSTIAAIQVVADSGEGSVTGNTFTGNSFALMGGMAIDLDANAVRDPNDPGDLDDGPNGLQNHPVITRATQSAITGSAGATCAGCTVEVYVADHAPGGVNDYGRTPIGTAVTDGAGDFVLSTPPVTPGQWVTALATNAGNTSEFGPGARVGTGVVQCGNVMLEPGWNHLGYFGTGPLTLGDAFPDDGGPGAVTAIYRLRDGERDYDAWFADMPFGNTLTTLTPGDSYWFYATSEAALPDGFALNLGLPVELHAGWNDFVYLGGGGNIRDALASIDGAYHNLYRWTNDGDGGGWAVYSTDVPAFAIDFDEIASCETYTILMDAAGTLQPLQP